MNKSIITLLMVTIFSGVCAAFIGNTIHKPSANSNSALMVQSGLDGSTGLTRYAVAKCLVVRKTSDNAKAPGSRIKYF